MPGRRAPDATGAPRTRGERRGRPGVGVGRRDEQFEAAQRPPLQGRLDAAAPGTADVGHADEGHCPDQQGRDLRVLPVEHERAQIDRSAGAGTRRRPTSWFHTESER